MGIVIISNLEFLSNTLNSSSSSSSNLFSDVFNDPGFIGIFGNSRISFFFCWFGSIEDVVVSLGSWLLGIIS
jgi:hypothetical protein